MIWKDVFFLRGIFVLFDRSLIGRLAVPLAGLLGSRQTTSSRDVRSRYETEIHMYQKHLWFSGCLESKLNKLVKNTVMDPLLARTTPLRKSRK